MAKNPKYNWEVNVEAIFDIQKSKFLRKGKAGDWKEYFNDDQCKIIDNLTSSTFDPVGLTLEDM